jgi:hypothetical protein
MFLKRESEINTDSPPFERAVVTGVIVKKLPPDKDRSRTLVLTQDSATEADIIKGIFVVLKSLNKHEDRVSDPFVAAMRW